MLTPYTSIKNKQDVVPLLNDNNFVLSLCDNLTFLIRKSISPNDESYICCPREQAPILGLYVKIYRFWIECLDVYKRGEFGVYIVYERILYEAFTKMVYLIVNGKEALDDFRLTSYKNRIKAYNKTEKEIDGVNLVRNTKLLEDLKADGFTIEDLKTNHSINFKTILNSVNQTYTQEEKDLIYTLGYGLSSDAIHSDWGELRQIHLSDIGDNMMIPNIGERVYNHYRVILTIADVISMAIQAFVPYINETQAVVIVGDALVSMAEDIQRVLRLIIEHVQDVYEDTPDGFMTI
jgi:hypothetical protein